MNELVGRLIILIETVSRQCYVSEKDVLFTFRDEAAIIILYYYIDSQT